MLDKSQDTENSKELTEDDYERLIEFYFADIVIEEESDFEEEFEGRTQCPRCDCECANENHIF